MKKIALSLTFALLVGFAGVSSPGPAQAAQNTATTFLGNVYFGKNSSHLTTQSKMKLKKIVRNNKKAISFKVKGYVQDRGSGRNEFKLSKARANAAKKFMKKIGVKVSIKAVPVGTPYSKATSPKARRVSVYGTFVTR